MDVTQYPEVRGSAALRRIITNSARTKRPALFLGPPGIGKTAIAVQVAAELQLSCAFLELGLTVPEEIGGVPVRVDGAPGTPGGLLRLPLGPIAQACSVPTILVIDEVTRADSQRQGAAMTGVNERRWGDYRLHPGSAVVLLGNEPDSGGTHTILDALLNRCGVYRFRAEAEDVRNYLSGLGADASPLRRFGEAYALFAENRPGELLQLDPPRGFAESGALWASPRAIHHGCERLAALEESGLNPADDLALAELCGVVGRQAGVTFMQLRRLADKCPSAREIQADPTGTRLPADLESLIAMNPVVLEVGKTDPDAAWLYLARLVEKHRDASKIIARKLFVTGKAPKGQGATVYGKISASMGSAMRAVTL